MNQREQRPASRQESKSEFEIRMRREFEDIIGGKFQKLLTEQTEASRLTADAARQLLELQLKHRQKDSKASTTEYSSSVRIKSTTASNAQRKGTSNSAASHSDGQRGTTSMTNTRSKDAERHTEGLNSLITKSESRVPEILSIVEKTEKSGEAIPKTLSEVIENLSFGDNNASSVSSEIKTEGASASTKSDITEDIAKEISASNDKRYSTDFEDEDSTIREKMSSSKSANKSPKRKRSDNRESSSSANANVTIRRKTEEKVPPLSALLEETSTTASTSSSVFVFPLSSPAVDLSDSFGKFTSDMYLNHLEEESLRARKQYELLKLKERKLKEDAEKELRTKDKSKDAVLKKYKDRMREIEALKRSIKVRT